MLGRAVIESSTKAWEDSDMRFHLNARQRIAAVFVLGVGAYLLGTWMTSLGLSVPRGSFTYSNATPLGLSAELQIAIWFLLAVTWATISFRLLRGSLVKPKSRINSYTKTTWY